MPVISSIAGKGIVSSSHPLSLGGGVVRAEVQEYLKCADVVLAVGTELSEVDSFEGTLESNGKIIRVDIDTRKMTDLYPVEVSLLGSASSSCTAIARDLGEVSARIETVAEVAEIRRQFRARLDVSQARHFTMLDLLRDILPRNTRVMGDACQLVYTGAFAFDVFAPRQWNYPGGYCTLGSALPDAIGAKLAQPDKPVVALAGDGGFMFTVQELVTGAELGLPLPILLWNNQGLKQIQDDMIARDIELVGVSGINPDFIALAQACRCHAIRAETADQLRAAFAAAFAADRPTLIEVREQDAWLN